MSNTKASDNSMWGRRIDTARKVSINKDIIKAVNEIKIDENFWNVTWKDNTFSIKPFLCSAISFLHIEELFDVICTDIVTFNDDFYKNLMKFSRDDFFNLFDEDDNYVYDSIAYQFCSFSPCVTRYLIGTNDIRCVKHILLMLVKEFTFTYNEMCHLEFRNKDICNTEAFSYYLSIFWVLQKSKKLQYMMMKEIKTRDFNTLLDLVCPSSSYHYKYISGEITAKELYDRYRGFYSSDETPLLILELFELYSKSSLDFNDDFKKLLEVVSGTGTFYVHYVDFMRIMSCSYISMGFFEEDCKRTYELESEISSLKSDVSDLKSKLKSVNSSLISTRKERNRLSDDLDKELSKDTDTSVFEKVKYLESVNYDLKTQISDLERYLVCKDNEINEQKQVIRKQIKELKSLNARLDELSIEHDDFDNDFIDTNDCVDINTMANSIRDLKICVFGGFDAGSIQEKFEKYGVSVEHIIGNKQFSVGDLDCAIILANNIQHSTVQRLKSQYKGEYVYCNGTSIELMIQEVYKKFYDKEDV